MSERRLDGELERIGRSVALARAQAAEHLPGAAASGPADTRARSVLALQSTAGNAAVATALQRSVAQRQPNQAPPKPPPPPQYVTDAQADLKLLFPKEKLMQGVVIKDYAKLNKTLQGASGYAAWTNSASEIFVKDPAGLTDTPKKQAMALKFVVQHEANHVRQFATAKGPPKTWEAMIRFEIEAYSNDIKFLNGPGKSIVTDAGLHKDFLDIATANLKQLRELVKGAGKLKGQERETFLLDGLLDNALIPPDSTANPLDLYKQP